MIHVQLITLIVKLNLKFPFTNCISEINNTLIDNGQDTDGAMPIIKYFLIEYSNNYLKASGLLWQYYRDEPALNNTDELDNFPGASFNFKQKYNRLDKSIKAVQIVVPWKYLSNFWRTLEMPLINCDINLILTWSAN